MSKVIVVDVERCMGCKSCELACAGVHSRAGDILEAVLSGERPGHSVSVEPCRGLAVPVHCSHCEDAPCLIACPTGAIYRENEEGPVLFDEEKCIGCRMCVQACPFGVITVNPEGKGILKCDMCIERIKEGLDPACVAACHTGALKFVEEKEAGKDKRAKTAEAIASSQETENK